MSTFYIDTTNFVTASSLWTDSNLTVIAPDGFYQKDGFYREMVNGELLPSEICPACLLPCGGSISANGNQGVYYLNMDLGNSTGATVIKFNVVGIPDGIEVTYNSVVYDELSSPVYGYLKGFIGRESSNCGLPISPSDPDFTGTLNVFEYQGTGFVATGTTESVSVPSTQVSLTPNVPGTSVMVVPKVAISPSNISLKMIGPCSGTAFSIQVLCPAPLPSFTGSEVRSSSSDACNQPKTTTYYYYDTNNSGGVEPNTTDWVFTDVNGVNRLPAGFYSLPSDQQIEVGVNGVVINKGACTFSSFTIYWNTATSPNQYGWDSSILACTGTGAPLTVYITGTATSLFDAVVTQGKFLYTDSGTTTFLDGNNTWYKTASGANQGGMFQVGVNGDVFNWNNSCI